MQLVINQKNIYTRA